jgi:hypothetical protein
MHVLSNMLLFSAVALVVEEKYGCWRIMLLWFLSALGGTSILLLSTVVTSQDMFQSSQFLSKTACNRLLRVTHLIRRV